jgi:hypothetical protein
MLLHGAVLDPILAFFSFLVGLWFELRASHFKTSIHKAGATPSVHFALVVFGDRVSQTICPGWP